MAEEDLASIRAELLRSQQVVKEQNMSADEVIRMNTEYDSLSQNVNEAGRKAQDGRNAVSSLEVAVANRGGRAEEVVDAYNDKLLALQLVDAAPDGTTLTLELNTASSTPDMILGGPDLRKVVKPALNRAAEQRRLEKAKLESEKLSVDHVLDKLTTDCDSEQEVMDVYIQETTQLTEHTNSIREASVLIYW
jgi:kinetochore protein NDC80